MRYEELQQAVEMFGLGERASLRQIKDRHRRLVRAAHPDTGADEPERIREINAAFACLRSYCEGYRFSFSREEFLEQNPEERLREQFGMDPVWRGR